MNRSLSLLSMLVFSLMVCSCKQGTNLSGEQLTGNWYFADERLDSLFVYNEVYFNQEQAHMRLSQTGLVVPMQWQLKGNKLFLHHPDSAAAAPYWLIEKVAADTLWVSTPGLEGQPANNLALIRLAKNEKGSLDYEPELWKKDEQLWQSYEADFQRRFDEFTVRTGRSSWAGIAREREKADSANEVKIVYEEPEQ